MKKLMAFVVVSFLTTSAAFAAVGVQGKADCKEILDKVKAAKAAAAQQAQPAAAPADTGAPKAQDAK